MPRTIYLVVASILLLTFTLLVNYGLLLFMGNHYLLHRKVVSLYAKEPSNKWIVITTTLHLTNAFTTLAAKAGWRVVAVVSQDTLSNWNLSNCVFLSVKKQKELGYSINQLISYPSYAKKMIGYLYAINNGAEWIYDMDSENHLMDLDLEQFAMADRVSGLSYGGKLNSLNQNLFNPYEFWGQAKIWPRGYPGENAKMKNDESAFHLCKQSKTPIIQQRFFVTEEPDIVAINQLLSEDVNEDVSFIRHAPPIALNSGTFCPFNSENTIFHRDAFWSLILPITVPTRVSDIWRSYYAQRLLHLIGHRLGFHAANTEQKQNSHSYFRDFVNKANIYSDAGRSIVYLTNWTCNFQSLPKCMIQLSSDFVEQGFWKAADLEVTKAWINDLQLMDYSFPSLIKDNREQHPLANSSSNLYQDEGCRRVFLHFPFDNSEKQEKRFRSYKEDIRDWCNEALPSENPLILRLNNTINFTTGIWRNLARTALIISGNYPFGPSLSLMQRLYEPHFATVIFCGTIYHGKIAQNQGYPKLHRFNFINVTEKEINNGYRAHMCTSKAIELNLRNIDGYLTIADDIAYNFYNDFDFSRFRLSKSGRPRPYWWRTKYGAAAMNKSISIIQNRTRDNPNSSLVKVMEAFARAINGTNVHLLLGEPDMVSASDFYYLPKENETFFYELSEIFFETQLFHEIVLPKIGAGLQWFNFYSSGEPDIATYIHLWGKERNVWEKRYAKDIICMHPMKLSYVKELKMRSKYCNLIIRNYFDSI